jgi:hypothetical protein
MRLAPQAEARPVAMRKPDNHRLRERTAAEARFMSPMGSQLPVKQKLLQICAELCKE